MARLEDRLDLLDRFLAMRAPEIIIENQKSLVVSADGAR